MNPSEGTVEGSDGIFDHSKSDELAPRDRQERWMATLTLWVLAPARIMWSDFRTRLGTLIIVFYLLMGTAGLQIVDPPSYHAGATFLSPFETAEFPLGTDGQGRDLLGLTVHATPAMLQMMLSGGLFATVVGTIVGTLAGYKRGAVERVLMTAADIVMTIPGLPLLIVLAMAVEPRHPATVGLLLGINGWAGLSRTIHSQVLALRSESYVEASRIMGVGSPSIIRDDILPSIMPYVMINFMTNSVNIIHTSVALYFLGVLPFTSLNWGVMINQAFNGGALSSLTAFHWILIPIIAINLLGFGVIIFSQGMDRIFNPRVRARHTNTGSGQVDSG